MKAQRDCIHCFTTRISFLVKKVIEDPLERERVLRILMGWMDPFPYEQPPPVSAREMYRIFSRETGIHDLYREERIQATTFLLDRLSELRTVIEGSEDPFVTSLKLALAGNAIDLAIREEIDLPGVIGVAGGMSLPDGVAEELHRRIGEARRVLVIGDNAGETVLDRLLVESFRTDDLEVHYSVRGYPILNDAVREDAEAAGIPLVANLIDTGSDVPGIVLEESSREFLDAFETADLILSKGQGNFETLYPCRREGLFFLFLVKCPLVAREVGQEMGTPIILEAL